jgi:hypothetical protein
MTDSAGGFYIHPAFHHGSLDLIPNDSNFLEFYYFSTCLGTTYAGYSM